MNCERINLQYPRSEDIMSKNYHFRQTTLYFYQLFYADELFKLRRNDDDVDFLSYKYASIPIFFVQPSNSMALLLFSPTILTEAILDSNLILYCTLY